jgi:hypothetical protein
MLMLSLNCFCGQLCLRGETSFNSRPESPRMIGQFMGLPGPGEMAWRPHEMARRPREMTKNLHEAGEKGPPPDYRKLRLKQRTRGPH